MYEDITAQKQAEAERARWQEEIIRTQAAALAELSTPLIPITDNVMVMPLIGTVDSRRAQQVIDSLLEGVASSRAQTAILDITGVPVVDTQVANALVRAAQSLGANPFTVFRTIMLPLLAPGVFSGALFAFGTSFDEVVTLLLIGGPQHRTLPREMFSSLREDISPTIAAAAALMLVTAVLLLVTVEWLKARTARLTRPAP